MCHAKKFLRKKKSFEPGKIETESLPGFDCVILTSAVVRERTKTREVHVDREIGLEFRSQIYRFLPKITRYRFLKASSLAKEFLRKKKSFEPRKIETESLPGFDCVMLTSAVVRE